MADLPSGTVAFLFTDIEGSTALWERDRQAMHAARLLAKAEALLQAEAAACSLPAREHDERTHGRAQKVLDDAAQTVAAAGQALTVEQALAEAVLDAVIDLLDAAATTKAAEGKP